MSSQGGEGASPPFQALVSCSRSFCGSLFSTGLSMSPLMYDHTCTHGISHMVSEGLWDPRIVTPLGDSLSSGLRTSHFSRSDLWRNTGVCLCRCAVGGARLLLGEGVRGTGRPPLEGLWKRHHWLHSRPVNSSRRRKDFFPLSDPMRELRKNGYFSRLRKKCLSQR